MTAESLGALTARALRGAWRTHPPPTTLSVADLDRVTPHLLATGCGGLGWWAVRGASALAATPAGRALADTRRLHQLHAGLHDRRLSAVLDLTASLGIDPLLVKGATIARRYPARGLRPYGDVDLVVRHDERARLEAALARRPVDSDRVEVDLDHAFMSVDGARLEDLRARSVTTVFGDHAVRTLGAEDELRLVCLHYLPSPSAPAPPPLPTSSGRAGRRTRWSWRCTSAGRSAASDQHICRSTTSPAAQPQRHSLGCPSAVRHLARKRRRTPFRSPSCARLGPRRSSGGPAQVAT